MTRLSNSPWLAAIVFLLLLTLAPEGRRAAADSGVTVGTHPATAWLDQVQRDIAADEYRVSWHGAPKVREIEPAWQAPNRAHGFRTYFTPEGIRVIPRTEAVPSWRWGLSLVGYGRGDDTSPSRTRAAVPAAGVVPAGARVEYRRGALTEFYENTERGLEQGFVLTAPPSEAGTDAGVDADPQPAHVDLALWGDLTPRIDADGQSIDFVTASGAPAVHYAQLEVTDSRGTVLPSHMEGFTGMGAVPGAGSGGIRLVFDDADAVYPVTIDPVATSPAWTFQGANLNDRLGIAAATAGDVNGDGYSDVIIGAMGYDGLAALGIGKAYLYLGSAMGLSSMAWAVNGDIQGAEFGRAAATAGDVNGDGYSDVIIGARGYTNGESNEGRAYLYLGSSTGLSLTPIWTAEGNQANAQFGNQVATAGDVNGDGYSDVIVGAHEYANGELYEGRAYVYLGSSAGLSPSPIWIGEENWFSAGFGFSVGTAGDVNGDGYADIIVGAPDHGFPEETRGRAYVYLGSASGPSPVAAWTADGGGPNSRFGWSVSTAGDMNGDGYAEIVVGSPDEGRAYVYQGSASGLGTSPHWYVSSTLGNPRMGESVSTAGDVNGDGFADIIIGEPGFTNGEAYEGGALIYLGSASGALLYTWGAEGNQANPCCNGFGKVVGPAGDVNGDGYADVIVSSPYHDAAVADVGKVFVYLGSPSGPAVTARWTAESDQSYTNFGISAQTAGDVNGDGYADVIVGASTFDNGETDEGRAYVYLGAAAGLSMTAAWTAEGNQATANFGISVGTAGDVNGDGYSDVIIGADQYDNSQAEEGRAFVYLGSATGLAATPVWTAESNQSLAQFGWRVATAGDVNGDGYSDVIVGAVAYDGGQTDEGRVYVYHGLPSGLTITPQWTGESDQANAHYGMAVATAGDVDADGFADVLVGASDYDNGQSNEGRVYLYRGSGSGLSTVPAWTAEGNRTRIGFGTSLGTAGDVNGDGRADVIIASPAYTGPELLEGRAEIYLGTVSGLATTPSWIGEGNQDNVTYGSSVGTAGDVNGDGFADVIVGAFEFDDPDLEEGRAYVYLGSAAGVGMAPAWTSEGNQLYAAFGASVGTAGDVNGDGYADIIVGALNYSNGEVFEGRAFLYYGNGGAGLSLRPQQRRADDTAPINTGGRSRVSKFRLAAAGRTPFGRGRARLEWEVKPLGQAFNGSGLARSTASLDTGVGAAGAPLDELVTGLQPGSYHWRARLLYDAPASPFAQRSRWFTTPWNGWNETDLNASTSLGGGVWADLNHDGIRGPGEPPVGSYVSLLSSTDQVVATLTTAADGHYSFEVGFPGSYRISFEPPCYAMTSQDQGSDDFLDSDADATGRTGLIGATFVEGDETRWSAGLVGAGGLDPIRQPVVITGVRGFDAANAGITFDIADPNPPIDVTGYNVYRTTNAALPLEAWGGVWWDRGDENAAAPGAQISVYGDPAVGSVYFFQVTAYNSTCVVEGPLLSTNDSTLSGGQR